MSFLQKAQTFVFKNIVETMTFNIFLVMQIKTFLVVYSTKTFCSTNYFKIRKYGKTSKYRKRNVKAMEIFCLYMY
jgi:hypothetical protein